MTWAESVKREFTERIQFTRNVGKNARMPSQCVRTGLSQKSLGTSIDTIPTWIGNAIQFFLPILVMVMRAVYRKGPNNTVPVHSPPAL